ncbi:MAG: hypothetical protein CSA62_05745 [Planctomycetota bacterium]|nr:MAG: hypothetical protein CSA62_05745 [Planctomycetota bacterium]
MNPKHGIAKRNSRDKLARNVIFLGGVAMVAGVVGIFLFLLAEVLPLLGGAEVAERSSEATPIAQPAVVIADEYQSHLVLMGKDASFAAIKVAQQEIVFSGRLPVGDNESITGVGKVPGRDALTASTDQGRVLVQAVSFKSHFAKAQDGEGRGERIVRPEKGDLTQVVVDEKKRAITCYAVQQAESGTVGVVAQLDDGNVLLSQRSVEVNQFTLEEEVSERKLETKFDGKLVHLLLTGDFRRVFGALDDGRLVWWDIRGEEFGSPQYGVAPQSMRKAQLPKITALEFLLGEQSLLVGRADGRVSIWFPVRIAEGRNDFKLSRIRRFSALEGEIIAIAASRRNKGFLALSSKGELEVSYSTTGVLDWKGSTNVPGASAITYTPKADGLVVAGSKQAKILSLKNEHPELTLGTLFTPVWYEGANQPAYEWQSTGATEDYEPKLSFMPLIVGTIKGTIFSMLFSIPIAVLGAMYVSQFMHFSLRRYIKPVIEIMAAIPSVVLGFLAAIWLAPKVESFFTSLLLMGLFLPAIIVAGGFLGLRLPVSFRARFPDGIASVFFIFAILVGAALCLLLGPVVEHLVFGGSFVLWATDVMGAPYEQRNAIVVGLAMSFAVIPIIFSISEDAFSNVPKTLVSGSLALGADRWQTVTKVVLPTASPGIFSATMVGFGRAVGETMIVLMATGNTAIMSMNPFNGFRALSANIAVEIPEAPVDGTLYRALFLSGLVLFAFTFFINTLAELVRSRLRKRYQAL